MINGNQPPPPPTADMTRYDYCEIRCPPPAMGQVLAKMGGDGWHLCTMLTATENSAPIVDGSGNRITAKQQHMLLVFSRPKGEVSHES